MSGMTRAVLALGLLVVVGLGDAASVGVIRY